MKLRWLSSLFCASLALLYLPGLTAQTSPLPAPVPAGRPSIGIALEGGGALGLAHIGVLQWLEEHHIPIDRLSGTSMGSLVGSLYATGSTPRQMAAIAEGKSFQQVFTFQSRYTDLNYRRRQDRRDLPQSITVGLAHGPGVRNALLSDQGVNAFLNRHLFAWNREELDFNRTPIPFRCVATNLTALAPKTFSSGPMPQAVRASISIPGVFPPVQSANGDYLVDGGILDNLPTDVLRNELHADRIIAVHMADAPLASSDTSSIVGVLNRAFSAGIAQNVASSLQHADLIIEVPTGGYSGMDYDKAAALIQLGYQAAAAAQDRLLPLALNETDWKLHLEDRASRRIAAPSRILQVETANASPGAAQQVQLDTLALRRQVPEPEAIHRALIPVQSNGDLSANYSFSAPSGSSSNDATLRVRLSKDPIGPPYLLIDPEMAASTSNINRAALNLRLIQQNFTGYGSELRFTARVGYRTDLSAEYYRLLASNGLFLQPELQIVRKPVYIWQDQKRIAERFQQNLQAGLQFGRTFSSHLQIAAEWSAIDTRWALRTGSDGSGYMRGNAQSAQLFLHLDESNSGSISPDGIRLNLSGGAFYNDAGRATAPLLHLEAARTRSWHDADIYAISAEANSYLRSDVPQPWRFSLGGPMRLSASSFDEYRGTDTLLTRAGWLHRVAALPLDLGQGLYTLVGFESGEIWSPESHAQLRQDGVVGLVGNTPIGLFTLGTSIGDAGHRKVFLTLGKIF